MINTKSQFVVSFGENEERNQGMVHMSEDFSCIYYILFLKKKD